jgi:tetratricopeptide (TPR) repeat protein
MMCSSVSPQHRQALSFGRTRRRTRSPRLAVMLAAVVIAAAAGGAGCAHRSAGAPGAARVVPRTSTAPAAIALFEDALVLIDEDRPDAAADKLAQALALDPRFALAHAVRAGVAPQADRPAHRQRASELAAGLPAAERLWIASMLSDRAGSAAAARAVAAAAPDDWRIQRELAFQAVYVDLDKRVARDAFERTLQLHPADPRPLGFLAMLYSDEERWADALAAARRHVAARPGEAEPLDVLAEVLLMTGDLAGAEATFAQILALRPAAGDVVAATTGIASVRFHRGDWQGGVQLLRDAAATAAEPADRRELLLTAFWALVTQGRTAEATALRAQLPAGEVDAAVERAIVATNVAVDTGQWSAALAASGPVIESAPAGSGATRWLLAMRVVAASRTGDLAEAERLLARLTAFPSDPEQPWLDNDVRFARAHVALARGETDAAVALFTHPLVLNHTSLYDPRRGMPRPGFEQFALEGKRLAAEALIAGGRPREAVALLDEITRSYRRGIGAVAVRLRALELRKRVSPA